MSRRLPLLVFLAMSCLVVSSAPAWGHPPVDALAAPVETTPVETTRVATAPVAATEAWHPAPGPAPVSWIVLAAAVAAVFTVRRKTRRGLAFAIVVVMTVFAFENGVHSVHHLDNHATGAACVVASAAAHVAGTPVDTTLVGYPVLPSLDAVVLEQTSKVDPLSLAVRQGRAPPLAA